MKQMNKDLLDEITDIEVLKDGYRSLNKLIMINESKLDQQQQEIERLNNDIKELLKENGNKEKVIIAQDNIIKEVREYINKIPTQPVIRVFKKELLEILDKENI